MSESALTLTTVMRPDDYPWLASFTSSFDDLLKKYISDMRDKQPNVDPYQIEQLISDLATHVDNCLAYRKEFHLLQAQAIKDALDAELYKRQRDTLFELEVNNSRAEVLNSDITYLGFAANEFNGAATDTLAKGFAALAQKDLMSAKVAQAGDTKRKELIKKKWNIQDQYQQALNDRHSEPGNTFNYGERIDRLLKFILDEIRDVYEKSKAVSAGVKQLYDIDHPLPTIDEDILDSLLLWNRQLVRQVNKMRREDVEFETIIPLVAPVNNNNKTSDGQFEGVVSATRFNDFFKSGAYVTLDVDLSKQFPDEYKFLRLKGVGLSFGVSSTKDLSQGGEWAWKYKRLSAVVFPPPVKDLFSNQDGEVKRRPAVLGTVAIDDPSYPVYFAQGPNVNNADPRGEWKIRVANFYRGVNEKADGRDANVTDLKLHLRLVAQPNPLAGAWPVDF